MSTKEAIDGILANRINKRDADASTGSIQKLRPYVIRADSPLVFFVGAGASMAGHTGMPPTWSIIYQLLYDSSIYCGLSSREDNKYTALLKTASDMLGFEVTLNDFWQICHDAINELYLSFAQLESKCTPNRVHTFLANWLASGRIVITTNYDCLIEREWIKVSRNNEKRYRNGEPNSFVNWRADLKGGACLFKIHGSSDDPVSCLGALEHVRTQLTGHRAEILVHVMHNHPICFVGWSGIDPDIPPLLFEAMKSRHSSLPVFWMHYEGNPPGSETLDQSIERMTPLIRPLAIQNPIITDADRAFGAMLQILGRSREANCPKKPFSFNFQQPVRRCTKAGLARMVGIALRRSGNFDAANMALDASWLLATTTEERSAALQEFSLLYQQIGGSDTARSRKFLQKARKVLGDQPDQMLRLNTDFGLLSQTIVALKHEPWQIANIPILFRRYRRDIEAFRDVAGREDVLALHTALYNLYLGRMRFKMMCGVAVKIPVLIGWVMRPFNVARSAIGESLDIHLHSRIDVLAYRASALAYFGDCESAREDLAEVSRLVAVLRDEARKEFWERQRKEIEDRCGSL
jgi:hypothetical protein